MALSMNIQKKAERKVDSYSFENSDGKNYILFAVDRELNKVEEAQLKSIIASYGIRSYIIASTKTNAVMGEHDQVIKFYVENDSHWKERYLENKEKYGYCQAVFAFGSSVYQITKSQDIDVYDTYFPYFNNYFYVGDRFLGPFNTFVFPMFKIADVLKSRSNNVMMTWRLNYFVRCLKQAKRNDMVMPYVHDYDIHVIKSTEEAIELFKKNHGQRYCSFDLETSGLDRSRDVIKCITLAFNKDEGYYINWSLMTDEAKKELSEMMRSCLHRLGVNAKFDIVFLWFNGIDRRVDVTDDVMLMEHSLCSTRHKGLKSMAYYYTDLGGYDGALDAYKKKTGVSDYSKIPEDILAPYATLDVIVALRCYFACKEAINKFDKEHPSEKPIELTGPFYRTVWDWYSKMAMGLYNYICECEFEGTYIDMDVYEKHWQILSEKVADYEEKLRKIFGVDANFNWNSSTQLEKLLVQEKGWPVVTEDGSFKADSDSLFQWKNMGLEGAAELDDYRHYFKALNAYLGVKTVKYDKKTGKRKEKLSGWKQFMREHPEDGSVRIHQNYSIIGTETFRFICNDPNFQAIPSHSLGANYVKMCMGLPKEDMYHVKMEDGTILDCVQEDQLYVTGIGYKRVIDLKEGDDIDMSKEPIWY